MHPAAVLGNGSAVSSRPNPHTCGVESPDFFLDPSEPERQRRGRTGIDGIWSSGDRVIWVSALILMLSTLMGWYTGSGVGVKLAVIGWNTGLLGKLVFFIGLATLAIVVLREVGIELPTSAPESLVILGLGALATVCVLIRVLSIPDAVLPADGRGIGLWISLVAALGVIVGGLLRAADEL